MTFFQVNKPNWFIKLDRFSINLIIINHELPEEMLMRAWPSLSARKNLHEVAAHIAVGNFALKEN
jgi:hypothetical protein